MIRLVISESAVHKSKAICRHTCIPFGIEIGSFSLRAQCWSRDHFSRARLNMLQTECLLLLATHWPKLPQAEMRFQNAPFDHAISIPYRQLSFLSDKNVKAKSAVLTSPDTTPVSWNPVAIVTSCRSVET